MKDIVLYPYAPNLIESTRSIGYSFETALADIIDNSISNFASKVDVKFALNDSPYVAIIDNGVGMSQDTLEQAMRYGSANSLEKRDIKDLGRFGLGLKMASMSQCRKLTVISKYEKNIVGACWDLDHINETKNWSLRVYSTKEVSNLHFYDYLTSVESGTVVLWEKFDKISGSSEDFEREFNEVLSHADKHMGLVFHRFLENKLLKEHFELYFNNRLVEPIDPFFISNKATQPLEEETLFINKIPIKIKPYITPYVNKLSKKERQIQNENKDLNLNQGLYIYRNKRLIVWGKWFYLLRESELSRLAKIRIDIPNSIDDYWTIDVKKSNAQIPTIIKHQLKQIIVRSVGKSERVYKYRGHLIQNDNYEHIWNKVKNREKTQYMINKDIPIYKALERSLNEEQIRLLDGLVKSVEGAFPYAAVYYDLAKDTQIEEITMSFDEVYRIAKSTMHNISENKENQIATIQTLKTIDLFQKYPEVIKIIEEEFNDEYK